MMIVESNNPMVEQVASCFKELFGEYDLITRSPGRINLIGEHTDYNNGFVLPAAVDKAAYVAMAKRNDNIIRLYAFDFKELLNCSLDDLTVPKGHWAAYMLGVVQQVKKFGFIVNGFNAVLTTDVPVGGGMSSSAAIECAMIFALNELFDLRLERLEMVKLAKKAENEFVGVQCGIMDMFTSMMGKKDAVIQLDCRSLLYEYFPLNLYKSKIVLFDTQVKHNLAGGEYNVRRQQCEEGVALLQPVYPKVKSLRDVNFSMLEMNLKNTASTVVYNRCRFIVEENLRVQMACQLLIRNDLKEFGRKMYLSHLGLSELYEVSCKELDLLVDMAKQETGIIGARMMGGGFGGCTINLIKEEMIEGIYEKFSKEYFKQTGIELKMYVTAPQHGTERIA